MYNKFINWFKKFLDSSTENLEKINRIGPCKECGNMWTTKCVDFQYDNGYGIMWCCDPYCDHRWLRWPMSAEEFESRAKNEI